MLYLQQVCKNITVRINSVGGSVLDGYGVASSIYNSSVPVTTIIDGLAASTALWCAAAGNIRKAVDFSSGMMHGSTGSEDKDMTDFVDKSINLQLSNRSGKTPDEIKAMMEKETWLNASEMKDAGLVDEIISTNKKVSVKKTDSLSNIAHIYNKLISPEMEKVTNRLKLKNDANEDSMVSAIDAIETGLKAEITELKNSLKLLQDEKTAKETEVKNALKTKAEALVNQAVLDRKIKEDEKPSLLETASNSQSGFDVVSNMLGKIAGGKQAHVIFDPKNVKETKTEKTYEELEVENPEYLSNLYKNDKPAFDELYNASKYVK